jgi:hypothetical protein
MVAAKTTHGRYAMRGAPNRLAQRSVRTLIQRVALTDKAMLLRTHLPAGMAARLDSAPEELRSPKHPSQVAFEALHAATPGNCLSLGLGMLGLGMGRRARAARARLGAGGAAADGAAAVAVRGRQTERLAAQAEAAAQAPWRAAIAAAREAKRAAWAARRAAREARGQTRNARNDPTRGAAVRCQTSNPRNDPMRGAAVVRARGAGAGAPLDARVDAPAGWQAGETVGRAPGSPGLGEALAREVMARRLRAELALRGNDPTRGPMGAGRRTKQPGGGAQVASFGPPLGGPPLGSTRALALGSTPLARTWEPSISETLAAVFGPAAPVGWVRAPVAPPGIAAMPSGDCAQRPHTGPSAREPDVLGDPVGPVFRQ